MDSGELLDFLSENGPQTGGELLEATCMDALPLWLLCKQTPEIRCKCIGRRYVRLDRNVEGYARLSPSIRREFLTYTVLGTEGQGDAVKARAETLHENIRSISRAKLELARESMATVTQALPEWPEMASQVCFIIAGDITYEMGHTVPRPEVSTGEMVRGSDLDILAIAEDTVPKKHLKALDDAILKKKYYLLTQPNYHEEIDYLVKDIAKVREQLAFDTFPHMIAGKILHESVFLHGSEVVFRKVKRLVSEHGVDAKLTELHRRAEEYRQNAEHALLGSDAAQPSAADMHLFYTSEEGDEIY
ncbi:MAG: hypothetical protein LBP68_04675 [Acidobacteriota bacterium]|jgi:hypothetical protein|nr:hypothetical protein [Acidobacteriota bacterium]